MATSDSEYSSSPSASPRGNASASDRAPPPALPADRAASVRSGRYMPPALKRQMLAAAAASQGATALAEQRASWEALKKKINGPVNKVSTSNIKDVVMELFKANLIRGRGLFCRSLMRAQSLSTAYTPVYAALVAVINTKLPVVGELLVTRLVLQFRRAFNRDDKGLCVSSAMFLAHLTNQRIAHEVLAFQVVSLLLETPTDDSVEVAVAFMREVGAFLAEIAPRVLNAVFDTFRSILHEADIDKRVQYMIEVLFQARRDGFKDSPPVRSGLDLVEAEEQIIHEVALDDEDLDVHDELNVFQLDSAYEENERKYAAISREILGDESDNGSEAESGSESGSASGSDSDVESDAMSEAGDSGDNRADTVVQTSGVQKIHDLTETEKVNLRRTIYLTIMSSLSFEEAAHKLLKIEVRPGEEQELCNMVIESCSQERTYKAFFGLVGERLCKLNRTWAHGFGLAFTSCYENIHRYETNHLRNIAHFFAHLLVTNALHLSVLQVVVLTEEATTSSSRIFLKIMLQDLAEELGLKALNDRLKSTEYRVSEAVKGMFPSSNAPAMRFAINYYTSIGLGAITEDMREQLKALPLLNAGDSSDSGSGSDSSSGSGSDSSSGSDSDSDTSSATSSRTYSSASPRSRSPHRSSPRGLHHQSPRRLSAQSAKPDAAQITPPPVLPVANELRKVGVDSSSTSIVQPSHLSTESRLRVRSPSYSPVEPAMVCAADQPTPATTLAAAAVEETNRNSSLSRKRHYSRSPSAGAGAAEREVKNMHELSLRDRGDRARSRSSSRYKRSDGYSRSRQYRSPSHSRSPLPRARYSRGYDHDEYRQSRDSRSRGSRRERERSLERTRSPARHRSSHESRADYRRR